LDALDPPASTEDRIAIAKLLAERRRAWLVQGWHEACRLPDPAGRLEMGLAVLAAHNSGARSEATLPQRLDQLAEEARAALGDCPDGVALARYLFHDRDFAGAREDYYAPHNSDLLHVLESRRGLPISLACIYMLVAHRLGIFAEGINWPGHFLARTAVDGEEFIVDGFDGGQCISRETFLRMQGPSRGAAEQVLDRPATPEAILARVLGNLITAYTQTGQFDQRDLMLCLLQELRDLHPEDHAVGGPR
jgi:regulator of sirC expression with transglutaminase-like and TPR domain